MLSVAIIVAVALFFLCVALVVKLDHTETLRKMEERASDFYMKAAEKWKHEAVKRGCPSGSNGLGYWNGE